MLRTPPGSSIRESTPCLPFPDAGELSLLFTAPIAEGEAFRYDAELVDPADEVVWRNEGMASLDRFGTSLVLLEGRAVSPGSYTLLLHETDLARDEVRQTFRYSFEIAAR